MAFPTFDQLRGSRFEPLDDPTLYTAPYGEGITFTTFTEGPGVFVVRYRLTAAQVTTLRTNFNTNRAHTAQSFTWQQDTSSHSVRWERWTEPAYRAPDIYDVTVRLRKVG